MGKREKKKYQNKKTQCIYVYSISNGKIRDTKNTHIEKGILFLGVAPKTMQRKIEKMHSK